MATANDDPTTRVGCEQCTGENPVWTTMKLTDDGIMVSVCDCGRAKVDTQSITDEKEMWLHTVHRDEKGRFTSPDDE